MMPRSAPSLVATCTATFGLHSSSSTVSSYSYFALGSALRSLTASSAELRPPIPLAAVPPVSGPMNPTLTLSFAAAGNGTSASTAAKATVDGTIVLIMATPPGWDIAGIVAHRRLGSKSNRLAFSRCDMRRPAARMFAMSPPMRFRLEFDRDNRNGEFRKRAPYLAAILLGGRTAHPNSAETRTESMAPFRSLLLLIRASLIGLLAGPACAQDWPAGRPLIMVIPFAAGGPTDVIGRVMAPAMSEVLHQQIVIENVGGAGG